MKAPIKCADQIKCFEMQQVQSGQLNVDRLAAGYAHVV